EDYRAYSELGGETAQMIADYIGLYGDRNAEELKLESRTFRTDPQLLVQKIVQYAENGISVNGTNAESKPLKGLCGVFAKKAAAGIKNREKSRLNRSRLYGMMRSMMLKVGGDLAVAKQISEPRDIFYLDYSEVERAVKSGEDMRELIESRRAQYSRFEKLPAYSRLVFAEKVFDKSSENMVGMTADNRADILTGIPCSGGKARGEILVIDDPSSCPDTTGKIIAAKMTDPGWVFLLAGAAGIITEKGALLSHTAIISRELGKPAVVGVDGAARLLKSGDVAEIDGTLGKITIIERIEI
ncbi:MAG: phosphoenolpyruvate synthase, partial [Oscillospiraceae bacterium]|nr:phosphoenolpyruvate synthase [Oscillospiraceae bacterium]